MPLGAAATSGATIAAAAAAYNRSDSNISAPDSQTSSEDSRSHTDPWMKGQEMSGGVSGRSLGDAAAALGSSHDDDDDGDQYQPAADMATSAGGLSYAPSGRQMMAGAGEMGLGDPNTRSTAGSALGTVTNSFAPSTAESTRSMSQSTSRPTFDRQDESVASIGGDMVAGTSFRSNSGGTYPIPPSSTSGFQESTSLATEEVRAEREAHELELAASGKEDSEVVIGAAAAAAAALGAGGGGLPSSRLSGGSRNSSFDATKGRPAHRVSSVGSMDAGALRELTDEEQLQRTQEADAARAASLLRASAVKVPLDPELERATSKEEQVRLYISCPSGPQCLIVCRLMYLCLC